MPLRSLTEAKLIDQVISSGNKVRSGLENVRKIPKITEFLTGILKISAAKNLRLLFTISADIDGLA